MKPLKLCEENVAKGSLEFKNLVYKLGSRIVLKINIFRSKDA